MGIDKLDKQNINYDNEVIKIRDNKDNEQQVKLSVFVAGMAVAADTQSALSVFDTNKDGKISGDEAGNIKKAIFDNAGEDKTLDDNEILKMFNVENNARNAKSILEQFKNMVQRQFSGNLETTVTTNDGKEIVSNFNSDGSGETKTTEPNGTITTCTYSAGKILTKKEVVDSERKQKIITYEYGENDKLVKTNTKLINKIGREKESTTVKYNYNEETGKLDSSETTIKAAGKKARKLTTTYIYDAESGKLADELTEEITGKPMMLPDGQSATPKKTTKIHYDYDDESGKVAKKTTEKKPDGITITAEFQDGKIQKQTTTEHRLKIKIDKGNFIPSFVDSSSVMEFSYHPNGSKKTVTISSTDSLGKTSDTRYEYEENGKMNYAEKSYFRRGVYVEEKYEGTNLENRVAGGVASEVIEYNDEGKTAIKQRIVNIFDEDGILIGDETYSKEGEKISEHDFSELDGKFDTAYQKGRGDCYLLAAINSLAGSEAGSKMLENIISQENGNFVIKFPGAKIARERLIKDLKAKNPKLDVSKINIPDKYTITAEELKQAMLKSGVKYSIGDKDVLLLEIAYEKYRESVVETLDENNLKPSDYMKGFSLNLDGDDYLSAGTGSEAIFILTGQKSEVYITKDYKKTPVCYIDSDFQMHITTPSGKLENANIINKIISATNSAESNKLIEKLKKATKDGVIQNYAATAGLKVSSQEVNGKVIKGGNHAFTIKSVTDDKVILANPWNPDVDVVMSMEDFLKAAYMIEVADVSKADNTPSNSPADGVGGEDGNQPVAPSSPTNQNGTIYTVPARKGYTTLIKEKLIEQGIEPTPENIQKAKAQFKAANPGAVKVYNGVKRAWRGNEYLLKGAEVNIPQFKTDADGNVL